MEEGYFLHTLFMGFLDALLGLPICETESCT